MNLSEGREIELSLISPQKRPKSVRQEQQWPYSNFRKGASQNPKKNKAFSSQRSSQGSTPLPKNSRISISLERKQSSIKINREVE